MVNGLYTAASAMCAEAENLDAISGNLANLSTPGYKRDIPTFSAQLQYYLSNNPLGILEPIGSVTPQQVRPSATIDLENGSLRHTDTPTDLGLQGPGFLVVRTPEGEAYTRNGAFTLAVDGTLTTHDGFPVLGENGPIRISGESWIVSQRGEVAVDGQVVGRLRLVDIPASSLRRAGGSLMLSATEPTKLNWTESKVYQGYLEQSNANTMWEMVSMITALRTFETNQKLIQAQDETLNQAVNQLGQV